MTKTPCNSEDELTAAHMAPEGFVTESIPEELDINHSGGSSEKSEFDSVGQETAKSMMKVLLPQALPLLKKVSKKKKERNGRTFTEDNSLNDRKSWEDVSFPVAGKSKS